jgi:hypothetical protein
MELEAAQAAPVLVTVLRVDTQRQAQLLDRMQTTALLVKRGSTST